MSPHGSMHSDEPSPSPLSVMSMVFYTSTSTPLFSTAWTPMGGGAFAGTCIFLVILAVVFRALFAGKHVLERRWLDNELNRRYIVVGGIATEAKVGTLITERSAEENVGVTRSRARTVTPWRLSVDLPRAAYVVVMTGVGYLLMLAVMTMNVGYFLSVLGGTFLGELVVGRYAQFGEH